MRNKSNGRVGWLLTALSCSGAAALSSCGGGSSPDTSAASAPADEYSHRCVENPAALVTVGIELFVPRKFVQHVPMTSYQNCLLVQIAFASVEICR